MFGRARTDLKVQAPTEHIIGMARGSGTQAVILASPASQDIDPMPQTAHCGSQPGNCSSGHECLCVPITTGTAQRFGSLGKARQLRESRRSVIFTSEPQNRLRVVPELRHSLLKVIVLVGLGSQFGP